MVVLAEFAPKPHFPSAAVTLPTTVRPFDRLKSSRRVDSSMSSAYRVYVKPKAFATEAISLSTS